MKHLFPIILLSVLTACQGKENLLLDQSRDLRDLRTGAAITGRQARKADACFGTLRTTLFDAPQAISFIRYRPENFYASPVAAERASADSVSALCMGAKALGGINGSYFNMDSLVTACFLKDDGQVIGGTDPSEYFRVNGAMLFSETGFTIEACDTTVVLADADKSWEAVAGGPILIDDGIPATYTETTVSGGWESFYAKRHPRTLVGQETDGTTWFIVIDGRADGNAEGMTISELTEFCQKLNLTDALNLDGGGSSTLWTLHGGVMNHPTDNHIFDAAGERVVPNIIIVR